MDVREKAKNDKRLIDANAFLKDILTAGIGKTIIEYSESDIGYMIRKRPTVDAVPAVRCRECKKHGLSAFYPDRLFCQEHGRYVDPDGYCYLGERKEGAD